MTSDRIHDMVRTQLPDIGKVLGDLIRFPSTSGREQDAMAFLDRLLKADGFQVEQVALSNALRQDPDYSNPIPDINYDGRFNLRVSLPGSGGGKTVLFNGHTDVVPPSVDQPDPWTPRLENGVLFGRGACDAKGQVATILLVLRTLKSLNIKLRGSVLAHLVNEEENGGNGTLAMARKGEKADACVVLEPTDRRVFTSIRGAVWFRLVFSGRAGHSGQAGVTRSALLMARDAMAILEAYHADLLKRSRGLPLFDVYPNPMPITFGHLEAGNWPASAPSRAVMEGVLGLLPNVTKEQVCAEMKAALAKGGDEFFAANTALTFMYRHDSSVIDPCADFSPALIRAAQAAGVPAEIAAMTASCDAWFYNNQLGIPTVVYGPGSLKVAHSKDEQIALDEIAGAAETLVRFILDYCGTSS
jgi:acetylornithine deacetylase